MKEQSFYSNNENTIPPQFDDERTLLSARQVVPLAKIDAKLTRRRRWILSGAFATAMILGAASALLASYLRLRTNSTVASQVTQVELTPEPLPLPADELVTEEPPAIAVLEEDEPAETAPDVVVEAPKTESTRKRRVVPRPESDYIPSRDTSDEVSEEDELERIRAAVLYNEWQERRQRRINRRERRRAERASRDLSNLDEIFEGPRRP